MASGLADGAAAADRLGLSGVMATTLELLDGRESVAASVPFDPDRLAYFEAAGWRAYYDRRWLRVLRLMAQLLREQLHLSFPRSGV